MLETGNVRYELVDNGSSESLLHCYIPKNFTARDVDLNYEADGIKGRIAIHFDTGPRGKIGCVQLDGFVFPESIDAKFSRKQSRYTFRLLKAQKSVSASKSDRDSGTQEDQDVEGPDHFSDAASSIPRSPSPADSTEAPGMEDLSAAAAAANGNGYGNHHTASQPLPDLPVSDVGDQAAESANADQIASESDQITARSEQITVESDQDDNILAQSLSAAAPAAGKDDSEADVAGNQAEDEDEEADEGTTDEAAKKGKKRRGQRRKKKRKGKTAGDDVSTSDADLASATAANSADSSSTAAAAAGADQEEQEVFLDAISEGEDDLLPANRQQHKQEDGETASPTAAATVETPKAKPQAAAPPVVFNSENYLSHFADESVAGSTELPASVAEVLQTPDSFLQGPFVSQCLDTHVQKGEDKGMRVVGAKWTPTGGSVGTSFSAFGIFDGHGGKPAATYASKELLPNVMKLVDRCKEGSCGSVSRQSSTAADDTAATADDADSYGIEVTDHDRAVWSAQEKLVDRLPKALFAGFLEADKICRQRHKVSGTTATLAIAVGWELFVANVGDSGAYLDTGKEVIAVSGNHRIDDNAAERARVIAAGGEVSKSCPEGVPVGPDRVWPGGLAMSRTIGDPQAPQVIAVPDIRHVTLPTTGGRLVIASDGVWDHMQPKGMIHQVRNESTEAAAKKIAYAAIKKKGLKDDVSVLVVDFTQAPGELRPPALLPGPQRDAVEPCQVNRPLMEIEVEAAGMATGVADDEIAASLQRQASVTSVAAAGGGHWKEVATARRTSALTLLRLQARHEAEAAAAEAARLADLAAKSVAESRSTVSDTYRELAELRLDPDAILAQVQAEQQQQQQQQDRTAAAPVAADAAEGWETVGSSSSASPGGYVPFEQQIKASASYGSGTSRGRGRGQRKQQRQDQGDSSYSRGAREYSRSHPQDHTAAAAAGEVGEPPASAVDNTADAQQQQYDGVRGGYRGGRGFRGRGRGGRYQQPGFRFDGKNSGNEQSYRRDVNHYTGYSRADREPEQQQQVHAGYAAADAGSAADSGNAPPPAQQQQQQFRGRGRGDGRGVYRGKGGFRGRGGGPAAAAGGDQQQQQQQESDQVDTSEQRSAGTNDQQQQTHQHEAKQRQQYKPRTQRQYKPVVAAAAGSSDASTADANDATSAVRVVPRSSKPAPAAAAQSDATAGNTATGGRHSNSVCYNCQQPGHFARDCPNAAAASDAGSAAASAAADQAIAGSGGGGASAAADRGSSGYRGRGNTGFRRSGGGYPRGGGGYSRGGGGRGRVGSYGQSQDHHQQQQQQTLPEAAQA